MPAYNATGPFYFAVGIAGSGEGGTTQLIKNVTLVGYAGVDNVIAKPAVFRDQDGNLYPAFTGYPITDGSNGTNEADRRMISGSYDPIPILPPPEVIEEVTLENGWYAVYRFDLPAGRTWGDFEKITAEYKFDAANLASGIGRGARLMGNYTEADFEFHTSDANTVALANYLNGKNAEYILHNTSGSSPFPPLVDFLTGLLGVAPAADQWFTLDYPIDGSTKHANYDIANMPAANATGPFYFGLGLPGQDNGGNTYQVKNVKLVGYEGVNDVIARPVVFTCDGVDYPAFTGYPTTDGSNGYAEANRTMVSGTFEKIPMLTVELGDFTFANSENQKGWVLEGVDWDVFVYGKYLVLETFVETEAWGYSGLQVVLQGAGGVPNWAQTGTVAWTSTDFDIANQYVYLVIDISVLDQLDVFITSGPGGKLILAYWVGGIAGLGIQRALLTDFELSKPGGAIDWLLADETTVFGHITRVNPF
jgi:hypothetical protein